MNLIYHFVEKEYFEKNRNRENYTPSSWKEDEFIHCTREPEMVVRVANYLENNNPADFLLLVIDEDLVESKVKYESISGKPPLFPHIYGPLNREALVGIYPFKRNPGGTFIFPDITSQTGNGKS